jgi:hypothetical protein
MLGNDMRIAISISLSCVFALLAPTGRLLAQQTPPAASSVTAEPPAAAPPTAAPSVLPPPPPPPTASELDAPGASACVPSCRSGYTCWSGRCISGCNPPCSLGESCSDAGECVAGAPDAEMTSPPPGAPDLSRGFDEGGSAYGGAGRGGVHRHDGFYLRLTLGLGGGVLGLDAPRGDSQDLAFAGGGWASSLDVGGSFGDNFALFGRVRQASIASPTVYIADEEVGDAESTTVSQGLLGVGFSYFIMPLNLYLGAAAGLSLISTHYDRPGRDERSEGYFGVGLDMEIGKEWWVSDNWGLGLAARLSFANAPAGDDAPDDSELGAVFIALLFSATYQ